VTAEGHVVSVERLSAVDVVVHGGLHHLQIGGGPVDLHGQTGIEPVKAYIACNLELEYALEYLMQRLEEAGVADKTCIVLTNDHYPYGLTEDEYNELAGQTLDTTFEKYRNSFICYVPGLSENIVVMNTAPRRTSCRHC